MIILGIDPGYEKIGVAVIEKPKVGLEILLFSDCIITDKKMLHHERLEHLGNVIVKIIDKYKPTVLATEKLFFNVNQKTAMKVSEARGVLLYVSAKAKLKIFEYTPLQIKVAVTGYGRADKKQIIMILPKLIAINKKILQDDEYDAIATALTASASGAR